MKDLSHGFYPLLLLLLISSCVPNRKVVYLQQADLNNRKSIPVDSVLRNHQMTINEYKIQPLDMLSVQFETLSDDNDAFDFLPKLSPQTQSAAQGNSIMLNGVFVSTEGAIEYPVLGKINVAGLTIFQAQKAIREAAARYVADVVVRVRMLNFRFTILGEVNKENTLISNNPRLTMMEAIGMAGGLTDLADRSMVKVIRQKGDQSEVIYIDLLKEEYISSPYYYVQQNDVIIVPGLKQRPFRRYFGQNLAVVSSLLSLTFSATLLVIAISNTNN